MISAHPHLKQKLLDEFHSTPIGGHFGVLRTFKRISANVYWEGISKDVQRYVASCALCQCSKIENSSPAGLL